MIAQAPQVQAVPTQTYISSGCQLPPCDTEAFTGDYLPWPTFSDLFTAININNPMLTKNCFTQMQKQVAMHTR